MAACVADASASLRRDTPTRRRVAEKDPGHISWVVGQPGPLSRGGTGGPAFHTFILPVLSKTFRYLTGKMELTWKTNTLERKLAEH
jgi:hypothetical protein